MKPLAALVVLVCGVSLLLAAEPDPCPEPPDPNADRALHGEWSLTKLGVDGKAVVPPGAFELSMHLDRGKMKMKFRGMEKAGSYKVNAPKKPAHIDITGDGRTTACIYKIDKGELIIASGRGPGAARPKSFDGAGAQIMIFRRARK